MFSIKVVSTDGAYDMISCDDFRVEMPLCGSTNKSEEKSIDECAVIHVWENHDDVNSKRYKVSNVAYIINDKGQTIDTIRV